MGTVIGFDDWLQAQNCLLGAALINPEFVATVVTELSPEDFSGKCLSVYKAMADLFSRSKGSGDVDAVAVSQYLGGTPESRSFVAQLMNCSPNFSEIDRYISMAKSQAKLSRLRSFGTELAEAPNLNDAMATAESIANQLMERPELKAYGPSELFDSFMIRHQNPPDRIPWTLRVVGDYIRLKKGFFLIIGAEPSGGKTAFALEQMWAFSLKRRVLFVSLETDKDTIFDRMISYMTGIDMDSLMNGTLDSNQIKQVNDAKEEILSKNFKIFPVADLSISGIKAAAIRCRADIVIIDYLQIIRLPGKKVSRYETITEISMGLHTLAQSTGLIIIALSQVTNRDPQSRGKPLGLHSVRESGQIEADADAVMMLDKFVEKDLRKSGCNANRVLRIVKNKNGRCANIPLYFNGKNQTFTRAFVPNPDWENAQKAEKQKKTKASSGEWEQLPMETEVVF